MVNIYLKIEHQHILLLSIPFSDIQRLTLSPVKWLRFVTFTICGAHGHLSETPNGPPANYDSSLTSPIANGYYYTPEGSTHI